LKYQLHNSKYDYEPFGAVLSQIGDSDRQSFIGKPTSGVEKDNESSLGDNPTGWLGVRKYDDFTSRFFQIDPLWEKYYGWTPYQYCRNNPISRIDANGMFDLRATLPENRVGNTGTLQVIDRNGNVVLSVNVLGQGQGRDRLETNNDTPLGTYDIGDVNGNVFWGGSEDTFGPNPRMVLRPNSGEIVDSGRDLIRVHGAPNEQTDANGNPVLRPTHGCLRVSNDDMELINNTLNSLLETDPLETPGQLEVEHQVNQENNDPPDYSPELRNHVPLPPL